MFSPSFQMKFFYLVTTGWIFYISLLPVRILSIIQSINQYASDTFMLYRTYYMPTSYQYNII